MFNCPPAQLVSIELVFHVKMIFKKCDTPCCMIFTNILLFTKARKEMSFGFVQNSIIFKKKPFISPFLYV